jgi:hypothetical protein
MNKLREYLAEYYDENALGAVRFVNKTCRLVKIGKHRWRGHKRMKEGAIVVDGTEMSSLVTTNPSWKLIPDRVKAEFSTFGGAIDVVVRDMCISGRTGDGSALVIGGGVYAVDTALWPECESTLTKIRDKWGAAADRWCTDDGYKELHELLKEQIGEVEYGKVKDLVPSAPALRATFWLEVTPLPWRLSEDIEYGTVSESAARKESTIDLIEAAVREPREQAASAWTGLAGQMVETGPGGVIAAVRPIRKGKDSIERPVSRSVRGDSVAVARRGYDVLQRAPRFNDPQTTIELKNIAAEIPSSEPDQRRLAVSWNGSDVEAVRVGAVLLRAAGVVANETNMIAGVVAALSRPT